MLSMEFKIGDVVTLKSGGVKMTVTQVPATMLEGTVRTEFVDCKWFNEKGELKHSVFHVDEIEKSK